MSREEFLTELRKALQGKVSQQTVNENIQYYEEYILAESHKGKTEAEVIAGLGEPRLLAKSIIDAGNAASAKNGTDRGYRTARQNGMDRQYDEEQHSSNGWQEKVSGEFSLKKAKIYAWLILAAVFIVALLLVILIAKVMVILLPILLPVVIIFFLFAAMNMNKRF